MRPNRAHEKNLPGGRVLQPGETGRELTDWEKRRAVREAAARRRALTSPDPLDVVIVEGMIARALDGVLEEDQP